MVPKSIMIPNLIGIDTYFGSMPEFWMVLIKGVLKCLPGYGVMVQFNARIGILFTKDVDLL